MKNTNTMKNTNAAAVLNPATNSTIMFEKESNRLINLFDESGIYLYFDDQEKKLLLDKYTIYYSSKLSAIQTLEEVFVNMAYGFHTDKVDPFIVDAGSEVGMATIFFKIFYPKAKILCFEAHPHAYALLNKNIQANSLEDITVVNAALANKEGSISFYGEYDFVADDLDTRGSSIIAAWGLQRETSSMITVDAAKLSDYVDHKVDYLKLNIEGAEQQVLEDLETNNKMDLVDRLLIKFHHSVKTQDINNLDYVYRILAKNKFLIKNRIQKKPEQIFPNITKGWAAENEVRLYTLFTTRITDDEAKQHKNTLEELQKKLYLLRKSLLEKETFLLRSVIDNVPASIYWKDKDGFYLGHSAYSVEKLHHTNIAPSVTIKNIIGKSDYDIFSKEVADKYRENDLYVMKNKANIILEEKVTTPEGAELIQLSSKRPLYDEKMNVVGIIGSTIDITDRKKAEYLQQEKEVAEQVNQAIEVLAGSIAHEIRTPLSIIALNAERLQTAASQDKSELVNNIKLAVKRGSNIIDMLLIKLRGLLAKQVSDQKFVANSIKACINDAISEYPFANNEDQNIIVWDDKANEDFFYLGNSLFTKHILFNLIKNSLRAIKEAERGKIYINLRADKKFNYLVLRDTATGIPAKNMESLFQQFNSHSKAGTGLGLAFCKMTMQSYGGDIICNSKEGEYAEFTLNFPMIETTK